MEEESEVLDVIDMPNESKKIKKTPAADTGSLDILDPPQSGKKKRKQKNKKKHKRNQSMLYSIVFTWHV